jgi:hypothetical protein
MGCLRYEERSAHTEIWPRIGSWSQKLFSVQRCNPGRRDHAGAANETGLTVELDHLVGLYEPGRMRFRQSGLRVSFPVRPQGQAAAFAGHVARPGTGRTLIETASCGQLPLARRRRPRHLSESAALGDGRKPGRDTRWETCSVGGTGIGCLLVLAHLMREAATPRDFRIGAEA